MAQDQPADRLGILQAEEGELEVSADLLAQEMVELATVLRLIGGAVTIATERVRVSDDPADPDVWATWRVMWRWKSGGPTARRRHVEPVPEVVEVVDEPVDAEPVTA